MSEPVELSIVTTLYRSAATIEEFVRRSTAAAEAVTSSFEIVIVDDGSPDNSLDDRDPTFANATRASRSSSSPAISGTTGR